VTAAAARGCLLLPPLPVVRCSRCGSKDHLCLDSSTVSRSEIAVIKKPSRSESRPRPGRSQALVEGKKKGAPQPVLEGANRPILTPLKINLKKLAGKVEVK